MLDYVITKNKDCNDFRFTRTHKTPKCYLDHRMVHSKVFVRPYGKRPLKSSLYLRINVASLKNSEMTKILKYI
uniref:Uncharacterized protein n=1 Tax=Octopus bimaculoides TaxID=37653 RepID=A0A0L8GDL5_OCTBM